MENNNNIEDKLEEFLKLGKRWTGTYVLMEEREKEMLQEIIEIVTTDPEAMKCLRILGGKELIEK